LPRHRHEFPLAVPLCKDRRGEMMTIAVDAMGGDHAPAEIVAGAVLAAGQISGEIILVGREPEVRAELARQAVVPPNVTVHHAEQVVEMDESPRLALRQKAGSSVTVCVDLVRDGVADVAISAGNSGALMVAATMRLGTLPGVQRPAIAVLLPTAIGRRIVLDAGANVDCKPEHLADFALMGSEYAEHALGVSRPRIGMLSIGTESGKGNDLSLAAYALLQQMPINFIGNVEGDQILAGEVDVTVCDGFVGNVVLKFYESIGDRAKLWLMGKHPRVKGLVGFVFDRVLPLKKLSYEGEEEGSGILWGVDGVVRIAHGACKAEHIVHGINAARKAVDADIVGSLKREIALFRAQGKL